MARMLLVFVIVLVHIVVGRRRILGPSNRTQIKDDSDEEIEKHRRRLFSVQQATNPEDHRVTSLPGLSESANLVHYAGHLTVDATKNSALFYWLFERAPPTSALTSPLIIWMNGGPGCSSMDGNFLELGPLRLDGENLDSIKINPSSWHSAANVMFLDQPVGTGLSYTLAKDGYATNDETINDHFYKFLLAFFSLHDRYTTMKAGRKVTRPLYLTGESHAGHYIPSMAAYIQRQNAKASTNELVITLEGVALGNPWSDPFNQYDPSDFARGLGLLSQGQSNKLKSLNAECQSLLKAGRLNQRVCFSLLDDVVDSTAAQSSHKVLMYDARKFVHSTSQFPPGHEAVEEYLNRPDVKQAIHATNAPQRYVECADPPYNALSYQDGKGVTAELVEILNSGLRVLIYSGQYDIICNHLGTDKMLRLLPWTSQSEWLKSQPGVWIVDKQPAGYIQSFKNLQSLLVLDSGHMVPMDQPRIALDMITRFVTNKAFSAGLSKLGVEPTDPMLECRPPHATAESSPVDLGTTRYLGGQLEASLLSSASSTSSVISIILLVVVVAVISLVQNCIRNSNSKRGALPEHSENSL